MQILVKENDTCCLPSGSESMFRSIFNLSCLAVLAVFLHNQAWAQVGDATGLWKWTERKPHHDAIVEVITSGGNGTGVVISISNDKPVKNGFEGYVLTAWHVIQDDLNSGKIKVGYRNGERSKGCTVVDFNQEMDVALLWVWVPAEIPAVPLASDPIEYGQTLEFAGLGGGSDIKCCIRHFAAVASPPSSIEKIFADVPLLPGDSGGPVFNERQEVVGIISGGWFWWDGGVIKTETNSKIPTTWPARACNIGPIKNLIGKIKVEDLAEIDGNPIIKR